MVAYGTLAATVRLPGEYFFRILSGCTGNRYVGFGDYRNMAYLAHGKSKSGEKFAVGIND